MTVRTCETCHWSGRRGQHQSLRCFYFDQKFRGIGWDCEFETSPTHPRPNACGPERKNFKPKVRE